MGLKKIFLLVLLVLTGLATVITLGVMAESSLGRGADDAMACGMGAGFFLLMSFAAFTAFDRKGVRWMAFAGCAVSGMMIVAMPLFVWWMDYVRTSGDYSQREFIGSLMGTGFALSGFLCLVPFVWAPKENLLIRSLQFGTTVCLACCFVFFMAMMWTRRGLGPEWERIVPAFFILSGAGMLAIFVLNRFFGIKVKDALSTVGLMMYIKCPRCLKDQDIAIGESACAFCKLKIKLEVEEPKCANCGYNLHQLTRPICPECGTPVEGAAAAAEPDSELIAWARANDAQKN